MEFECDFLKAFSLGRDTTDDVVSRPRLYCAARTLLQILIA